MKWPSARTIYDGITFIPRMRCHAQAATANAILDATDRLSFTGRIVFAIPVTIATSYLLLRAHAGLAIIEFFRPTKEDFPGIKRPG